ncbi:UvrD-helicase domain-containing protein [Pseudomonas sp. lyk4-TYG-107]|uniref:UvrD-helicase domain-containing protein n=1 Tax=Pseudomonas sp. lyk4-TYG-107 TaxID=3040317 RepID=UPI002553A5B3|nr:UvrD-helicase domain-containing protein [Pseudomonas sp. lyk4-TYG-107]
MTQEAFRSFGWVRWLGAGCASIDNASNGLIAVDWQGRASTITVAGMPRPPELSRWLVLSRLKLNAATGPVVAIGWGVSKPYQLWRSALREWYADRVRSVAGDLNSFFERLRRTGYCRRSQWTDLHAELVKQSALWPTLPDRGLGVLSREERKVLIRARSWVRNGERCLRRWRAHYVKTSLVKYADLFDQVETMPLTRKQRLACIVDEDNNLVLAGAGTGKTSTTIGRVAFLVKSGQARPDEILLLAYGNDAAKEMRERLESRLGVKGVEALTFHSLGKSILQHPSLSPMADDEPARKRFVQLAFERLQNEPEYRKQLLQYFEHYLYPIRNPFDFASLGEYFRYLAEHEVRTLKSERVKSMAECRIANFLFKMGVDYRYEYAYKVSTRTPERRQYRPDFYLPDFDLYIEHFGVDRKGNTAPYVNRASYQEGMEWKRQLHKKHQTSLIETFHYEQQEGVLLKVLEERLAAAGVKFDPMPEEALLETLREFGVVSAFAELLEELLKCYKAADLSPTELEARVKAAPDPDQMRAALDLLEPIYEQYQKELELNEQIDFDDMIVRAIERVEEGGYTPPWRFILVDEFQDTSNPRARLVRGLRRLQPDGSLFCVGDDWQSIYRFTGSDITLTSEFDKFFGPTVTSALDKTFRFNDRISEVASRFVMRNPAQLFKKMSTHVEEADPAVSLFRTDLKDEQALDQVIARINARAGAGASVYILARFSFGLPDKNKFDQLARLYPKLMIRVDSIHSSKGQEADFVVLLGNKSGKFGLPSEKTSHPLVDALLPPRENFTHAEERRLFYVALTRAKQRVYLVAGENKVSSFVKELLDDEYDLELNEFGTPAPIVSGPPCPACVTGELTLRKRTKKDEYFYGCSFAPMCSHTESACPDCRSPMHERDKYLICAQNCGGWIALCPKSGGRMVWQQTDRPFWGCSDYRGKDPGSCTHKEYRITPPHGCRARAVT